MAELRKIPISLPVTGEEEWQAVRESLMNGWLTQGPKVAGFESAFAERHQAVHAIAASSCTTALHMILAAMGIGPGDEVIVPAFTWIATANVVLYCGARPVFADVERESFNISPREVAARVTSRTKAVMPVHLFGLCADMDELAKAAPGIPLVEDAACAAGSRYKGRFAGTLGLAGAFSFHPRKSITTGEGGMVTTNDSALADKVRMLRNHGAAVSEEERHRGPRPYLLPEFNILGFNYRMTDVQGAIGLVQLAKLDAFLSERKRWAEFYNKELAGIGWIRPPRAPQDCEHGWQSYVCFVDEKKAPLSRNGLMEFLQARGISTRPGTHAVPMLGYYRNTFGFKPEDFPGAYDCDRFTIALPLHNRMTAEDYQYVIEAVKEAGV